VRFFEEAFGVGTVQQIIDNAGKMCGDGGFFSNYVPFPSYVGALFDTTPGEIAKRFEAWAKNAVSPGLSAGHPFSSLQTIDELGIGEIDSLAVSPDGNTIFYRTLEMDTGISRLYLRDLNDAGSRIRLAEDNSLGLVSLHPRDRRVTALGDGLLVYIGR